MPLDRSLPVVGATSQGKLRIWTVMITIDPPTDIPYYTKLVTMTRRIPVWRPEAIFQITQNMLW